MLSLPYHYCLVLSISPVQSCPWIMAGVVKFTCYSLRLHARYNNAGGKAHIVPEFPRKHENYRRETERGQQNRKHFLSSLMKRALKSDV